MNAACGAKTSNGKEAMFEELHRKMNAFWNNDRTLSQTDPEYVKLFSDFAYGEVVNEPGANHPDLDDQTRSLAILAALVGCQGLDAFEMMLPVAYETGLTSVAIKEMIYQATAYCGFGRTLPFLKKLNVFLGAANVHLPLEPQGTTTSETRAQAGEDKRVEIFGENMHGFAQSGPEETRHINKWLATASATTTLAADSTPASAKWSRCVSWPRRVVANRSLRRMPRRIWSSAMRRRF